MVPRAENVWVRRGQQNGVEGGEGGGEAREVGQGSFVNELFLCVTTGSQRDLLRLLDTTLVVSHCPGMLGCLLRNSDGESRPPRKTADGHLRLSKELFNG